MAIKLLSYLRNTFIILLFLFISSALFAQDLSLRGSVRDDASGETLIGVTLLIKGTQTGTISDIEGNYEITVPQGSVIAVSYIGYVTKEFKPEKSGTYDIRLVSAVTELDKFIVIGYATQKKEDKTGAVSNVQAGDLQGGVLTDPIQGLQGKASGVSVTKKGGDPNEGFSVRIRGASGFDATTQPLFVIDGVPGVDPTIIAPEDIESVNILKDAASTAIYGSRGSNGVIIITTKKGAGLQAKSGKTSYSEVKFSSQVSIENTARRLDMLSASDMRDYVDILLQDELDEHPGWTADSIFTDGGANTDWQDEIYRTGISLSNNLSLAGGNKKTTYYASLTQSNWEGIMKGTSKDRTSARLNFTNSSIQDKLRVSGNLIATFEKNDYENYDGYDKDDVIYQALQRNPTDPVYDENGGYYQSNRVFNYENPIAIINEITNTRDAKRYLGNFRADYEPIEGLIFSGNFSYLRDDHEKSYFRPANLYASADNGNGKREYENETEKIMELTATYRKSFNDVHNLEFLGGYSWQEYEKDGFSAEANNAHSDYVGSDNLQIFSNVKWGDVKSWRLKSNLIGFFARAQYNFDQRYYLTGSLRRDGSSKFGYNNEWGWFPTAAIGWNMHYEEFMSKVDWLDQLKVRLSFGISGNQEIGEYRSIEVYQPQSLATNPETGQEVVSFYQPWNANPDLKWEETSEYNLGIDFAIFNYKVSGSLEFYLKETTDLLGEYSVPVPPNRARKTYGNSGTFENKGIELFLQTYPVSLDNFNWKTSLSASHNRTIVKDLGDFFQNRNEGTIDGRGLIGDEYYVRSLLEGESLGIFYLPTYVTILNGDFVYISESGGFTKNLSEAKRTVVADALPYLELGWSNSLTFKKNWHLDFTFRAMLGNHVYNATKMWFDVPGNLPSLNGIEEAIEWRELGRASGGAIADIYVEDASFLKLDFLALSYSFDLKKDNWVKDLNLFASANNLLTITGYSGIDPETKIDGLDFGIDLFSVYPKTRSYTFGLRATF